MDHPHAAGPGSQRHVAGSFDVDGPRLLEPGPADAYLGGRVDHAAGAGQGPFKGVAVADVAAGDLDVEASQRTRI